MTLRPRPMVLLILDGWGYREEQAANAIAAADKPTWDKLWHHAVHGLIAGSGRCVGLPDGQMGNSEVGHLTIGAGRVLVPALTRIDAAIEKGDFFQNTCLTQALKKAKQTNQAVHLMGLLSAGGVHSHERHFHAVIELAAYLQVPSVFIHAFLDGRDTPPRSALTSLEQLDQHCLQLQCGQVVSLIGRYYAMDRDKHWDRIQQAYELLVEGRAVYQASTAREGLLLAYARGESDEFVQATSIRAVNQQKPVTVQDGDIVLFMNFRADRARELTQAFVEPLFHDFTRIAWPQLGQWVCLTEYDPQWAVAVAFPPEPLTHILGDCISAAGLKQLRIAETEKYAHVTFFFNGGVEQPYPGEERLLIPSPSVATYDLQPEMSAPTLTDHLIQAIHRQDYDVVIGNFANPDMVGHTGCFQATVKAIEVVDQCLGRIVEALAAVKGELLITADHGNAEQLFDETTQQLHTAHTSHLVPFIYVGRPAILTQQKGTLSDIAPTLLYLMGLPQPTEMTGESLVKLTDPPERG